MSAPELLDVAAVLERYGLRDRRAARRVMDAAGGFVVAGRLLVRVEDLVAHEDELRQARGRGTASARPPSRNTVTRRRRRPPAERREPLQPGWWREGADPAQAA